MLDRKKKRLLFQIGAFLIPFIFFFFFLYIKNSDLIDLIISDANVQYSHLFQYLKSVLDGNQSLFYNFSKGLGGSMYGTFFYYLSSPLNLFLIFIPHQYILDFMGFLMLFKISLSGFTMFYYLKQRSNHDFINFILSLSYAFMSYHIIYYFNIMWLDAIYLLPLVINGLARILQNKKSISYIIFLFLTILSNYYIAYMVCIFLVLYFGYRIFTIYNLKNDKKIIFQIIKKFMISSLLAGLLASFLIFPVLNELSDSMRDAYFSGSKSILNQIMGVISQAGIERQFPNRVYSVPNYFCGFFVFSIIINYFLVKKRNTAKKSVAVVCILLFLSMILPPLNILWHGFINSIVFNHRWTFLISFFLIIIASEKYQYLEELSHKKIVFLALIYFLILAISNYLFDHTFDIFILLLNTFLLVSNLLLLNIVLKYRFSLYKISLIVILFVEVIINFKINFFIMSLTEKPKEILSYEESYKLNSELDRFVKDGYRVGGATIYQANELFNSDFSRVSYFLSTINGRVVKFLNNTGYFLASNSSYDNENQTVINSLLGIRYWYGKNSSNDFQRVGALNLKKKIPIYENKKVPTFGYLINKKEITKNANNPFEYQNMVLKNMGYSSVFQRQKVSKLKNNKYQIKTDGENELYFYITEKGNNDYPKKLTLNNKKIKEKYFTYLGILKVSVSPDNKNYHLKIEGAGEIDNVFVYSLDREKVNHILKDLKTKEIKNVKTNQNKLEFNVSVEGKQKDLLLTIPYENGWQIYVDGKKTSYKEFTDTFITIPLDDGNHHIKMVYIPKFLFIGIMTSVTSLIFTIYYVKRKGNVKSIDN